MFSFSCFQIRRIECMNVICFQVTQVSAKTTAFQSQSQKKVQETLCCMYLGLFGGVVLHK